MHLSPQQMVFFELSRNVTVCYLSRIFKRLGNTLEYGSFVNE